MKRTKDKFDALDEDFKSSIASMTKEEIDNRIAGWAKLGEQSGQEMKDDADLAEKKEAVKYLSTPYREAIKMSRLRIAWGMQVLVDRGSE